MYISYKKAVCLAAVLLAPTACHDEDSDLAGKLAAAGESCFETGGKEQVLDIMEHWYLWNDEAAQFDKYSGIDPESYEDVDDLLDFLRYRPEIFDRGFTHTSVPAEEDAFFGEGEFAGFGFSLIQSGTILRVSQVFENSPADDAGVRRGYTLTHIDGRSIALIAADEGIDTALGPSATGVSRELTFNDTAGDPLPPVVLTKEIVTIDPLPVVNIMPNGGTPVGYLLFRTFISTADPALRNAFAELKSQNVRHVIVDFRYNGGGLVSTARTAASLMAGPGNAGNVLAYQRYNSDRAPGYNTELTFSGEPDAADLETIVFITTGGTASASELVINGLEPYFTMTDEIAVVGQRSFGKPVGQSGFNFCDEQWRLRAVTFRSENVAGFGDYFNGLPVDCPAADDLGRQLGDPDEAMLAEALNYLNNGTCTGSTMRAPAAAGEPSYRPVTGHQSWKQNAYAY